MKYNLDENNQKWLDKIYEKIMAKMSAPVSYTHLDVYKRQELGR